MDASHTFHLKRIGQWITITVFLGLIAVAIALIWIGKTELGFILGGLVLAMGLLSRHDFYQRVTIDKTGIRYKRLLDRERALYWSNVSGARMRGHWLELFGKPKPIRIWIGPSFKEKDGLLVLLAKHLPHLVTLAQPPTLDELEAPSNLPLVARSRIAFQLLLALFVLPFGLLMVAMGGIMAYGALSPLNLLGLVMAVFFLVFGGWMLICLVSLVPQTITLDEDGVRVRSLWRGGYLPWSQIEAALWHRPIRYVHLGGEDKTLGFDLDVFSKKDRNEIVKVLGYYCTLHHIPFRYGKRLLP